MPSPTPFRETYADLTPAQRAGCAGYIRAVDGVRRAAAFNARLQADVNRALAATRYDPAAAFALLMGEQQAKSDAAREARRAATPETMLAQVLAGRRAA